MVIGATGLLGHRVHRTAGPTVRPLDALEPVQTPQYSMGETHAPGTVVKLQRAIP